MLTLDRSSQLKRMSLQTVVIMINEDDCNNDKQNLELLPYKKNVSFKWEKLQFEDKFEFEDQLTFNLWNNNFILETNIDINDNLEIRYKHGKNFVVFKLEIENISGAIKRGQLERIRYFRPTSIIQTGLIYDIFGILENKLCEKLDINFLDVIDRAGLIRITCKQKLPLNKVVYFRNLVVIFGRIEKITYRGKKKYCIVSNMTSGDVLLQE